MNDREESSSEFDTRAALEARIEEIEDALTKLEQAGERLKVICAELATEANYSPVRLAVLMEHGDACRRARSLLRVRLPEASGNG